MITDKHTVVNFFLIVSNKPDPILTFQKAKTKKLSAISTHLTR